MEECTGFARNETAMRDKWISKALKIHRLTLEKAEEKANVATAKRLALKVSEVEEEDKIDDDSYQGSDNDNDSDNDNEFDRNSNKEEKSFSGGFSLEQCMVAVRLKAKEREEAANNRQPETMPDGPDGWCFTVLFFIV